MKAGDVLPTASAVLGSPVVYLGAIPSLLARLGLRPAAPALEEDDLPDVSAVENGGTPEAVINYLSVSQLKKAAECERKWWFTKVLHLEEPSRASQELGKQVHKQLEHYMLTGENVLGDIARAALPYLPKPDPLKLVEASITASNKPISGPTLTADGIPLVGFIDRIDEGAVPRAADYKTSKNPEQWAATPAQLATTAEQPGIQMVGYAISLAEQLGLRDDALIELEHLYLHTKPTKADKAAKRDAKQVIGTITPKKARDEWERMNLLARRLRDVAKANSLNEVRPTWTACKNFGGCFFQAQCLIHQTKAKEQNVNLAARILNRPTTPTTTTPTTTPPPAATTPEPKLRLVDLTGDQVLKAAEQNPHGSTTELKAAATATIVPPDAPKSDPKLAAEQPPAPPPPSAAAAAAGEPEKPKKARAAKSPASTGSELRVFVDCMPNAIESQPLAGYVAGLIGDMEKTFKCIDIRCAAKKYKTDEGQELENPLAYGGWKGVLSAAIKVQPPAAGTYVVLGASGSEIMQVVTEALESLCAPGNFVRGVR